MIRGNARDLCKECRRRDNQESSDRWTLCNGVSPDVVSFMSGDGEECGDFKAYSRDKPKRC